MHSENEGKRGEAAPRQLSGRGLAYWTDGRERRGSSTSRPATSWSRSTRRPASPVAGFGKNGIVDLKLDDDQPMDLGHRRDRPARDARSSRRTSSSSAPRTCRAARRRARHNEKGYIRGFDVRTGKRLWIFHTIPRPGEFGNDTWEKDSWAYTGNAGVWAQMTRRRRARPGLPAGRAADRRLLRRPSSRATACSARASSRSI